MKTLHTRLAVALLLLNLANSGASAQSPPPACDTCIQLNAWYFADTNWLSADPA